MEHTASWNWAWVVGDSCLASRPWPSGAPSEQAHRAASEAETNAPDPALPDAASPSVPARRRPRPGRCPFAGRRPHMSRRVRRDGTVGSDGAHVSSLVRRHPRSSGDAGRCPRPDPSRSEGHAPRLVGRGCGASDRAGALRPRTTRATSLVRRRRRRAGRTGRARPKEDEGCCRGAPVRPPAGGAHRDPF
jgi:hypothetical protein